MSDPEKAAKLADLLNEAWREYRDEITARVEAVRGAIVLAEQAGLDDEKRAAANSAAHKLAGVLGTFGLKEASRAALEIEQKLAPEANLDQSAILRCRGLMQQVDIAVASRDAAA